MKRQRSISIATLLVFSMFSMAAAGAAEAAPPILRVRAASLDAVLHDISAAATAVGHPVEREAMLAGLAMALRVPDLSFVDATKPLALCMPMEGMALGPNGMVAVLPVKDRSKSIAALTEAFEGHTFDSDVHTFTAEEGGSTLFVREAEGVLIAGPTREILAAIDPAEALSGKDLPAGSAVFSLEIEPIAPMLESGIGFARQMMVEGPPRPPAGSEDDEAAAPNPVPKEAVPFMEVYFDLLQDGIDNVSRLHLALSVEGGSIVVRNRLVAKDDSALGAFCAAQVLRGSAAAARLAPEDAAMRLAGRVQWTPQALAYLTDYTRRTMDAIRATVAEADPAVVHQLEAWLEMWDLTGPSQMMQCSRGDFGISSGYLPDGKQTTLQAFGLETTKACSEVLQSHLERIRSKGRLSESLVEETLEPEKLKTAIVRYTSPTLPLPGASAGESPEEVVVRLAQADDMFLLGFGEGSADDFRSVLARRPATKDAPVPTSASFVTGHMDVGKILRSTPAQGQPEEDSLRAFASALEGSSGKIVLSMRFLDSGADLEIGVPLGLIDALGKGAAADAKARAEAEAEAEAESEDE